MLQRGERVDRTPVAHSGSAAVGACFPFVIGRSLKSCQSQESIRGHHLCENGVGNFLVSHRIGRGRQDGIGIPCQQHSIYAYIIRVCVDGRETAAFVSKSGLRQECCTVCICRNRCSIGHVGELGGLVCPVEIGVFPRHPDGVLEFYQQVPTGIWKRLIQRDHHG